MSWTMRIPNTLREQALADLERPHAFAFERVGFVLCRVGALESGDRLILPFEYMPVPDGHYIDDASVGARINGDAIRTAMAAALAGHTAVLHVHTHGGRGMPMFSRTDLQNYPKLIRALQNAGPGVPHGALLLSGDSANALVWMSGSTNPVAGGRIVIVGRPMGFQETGALYA